MTCSMRGRAWRLPVLAGLVAACLALSAAEGRAQIFISGGYPVYGSSGFYGPFGGYSSYGSTYVSGFGLGLGGIGTSYSSYYGVPGYAYGGYPAYGYPGYVGYPYYGYPGYGTWFPRPVPPIGPGPSTPPSPSTPGGRGPGGNDSVVGGTHIPGFGVVGGLR